MGTIANQLLTAFRDFVRFTGDGLPGEPLGRPLPQGDPASGQFNPPKKQVREALLAIAETSDNLNEAAEGTAADRVQTGLDAAVTLANSALSATYRDQAKVAAVAAGAPVVTVLSDPTPANGTIEILQTVVETQVWKVVSGIWDFVGWLNRPQFATAAQFDAFSGTIASGVEVSSGRLRWKIVSSGEDFTTTGGNKVQIIPNNADEIDWLATAAVSGAASHNAQWAAIVSCMTRTGAKTINWPVGTWRFGYQVLPEGTVHNCVRWLTIFRPVSADDRSAFTQDSGSDDLFENGPIFKGATFMGAEITPTFSEQKHLITLHGVEWFSFHESQFVGWRGDAIYIGSSDTGGTTERHNRNGFISECLFNGVNRANRNAISLIDIDTIWITKNIFQNCSAPNMPGPIDFEPNGNGFHVIRNIWVTENRFIDCGGNVGLISVYVAAALSAGMEAPYNINIHDNVQEGSFQTSASAFIFISGAGNEPTETSDDWGISVTGNKGRNGNCPIYLASCKGADFSGNVFKDYKLNSFIGPLTSTSLVRDVSIRDRFIRCGSTVDSALDVFNVSGLDLSGTVFEDCGNGINPAAAINFKSGASEKVKLNKIKVTSPTGKTLRAVVKDAGHVYSPETNECFSPDIGDLLFNFEAVQSDFLWTSYAPIVAGSTAAGTGTYTTQIGRYQMQGKRVFVDTVKVAVSSHTGTGQIQIKMPVTAANVSGNAETMMPITVTGAATTGGQIGWLNPGLVVDGSTGVRCVQTSTGPLLPINIPGGAFTVQVSGSYLAG
ncbi:hypothetical protein UM399_11855 [Sulfitobacter pontiacus]|uniref:hypothetical protein n=1 Tax=Sulfitobacter pontiacus TaxID=60137 RepID=UPI002AC9765A|nr:hypothetical protein [Sulfitobacter pontiacus]WPZ24857.1 hypothetical protein UM399_11855 [Sulfitobacter pontiacus]|tara:strand:+ start:1694 stop:4027 length:2334 start_codon:yes stop_codon:yes gene_type:complete